MRKRKNPRLVKAVLQLPISNVREILTHQAYCRKSLHDDIDVLFTEVNTLHEANDTDHDLIFSKIESLRSFVERSFIIFGCICVLMCILILL